VDGVIPKDGMNLSSPWRDGSIIKSSERTNQEKRISSKCQRTSRE